MTNTGIQQKMPAGKTESAGNLLVHSDKTINGKPTKKQVNILPEICIGWNHPKMQPKPSHE